MGSETRPSALLLAPETPYPLAGGGALRTASLLHHLSRAYDVDLIVFRQPGAAGTPPRCCAAGTAGAERPGDRSPAEWQEPGSASTAECRAGGAPGPATAGPVFRVRRPHRRRSPGPSIRSRYHRALLVRTLLGIRLRRFALARSSICTTSNRCFISDRRKWRATPRHSRTACSARRRWSWSGELAAPGFSEVLATSESDAELARAIAPKRTCHGVPECHPG